MAVLKVRTKPIDVFYVTGDDAEAAREAAGDGRNGPCFVTAMHGDDGFCWDSCEQFEQDHAATFPDEPLAALMRVVPWLGKMIADGGHMTSVAPNDAIRSLQMAEAAIAKAKGRK